MARRKLVIQAEYARMKGVVPSTVMRRVRKGMPTHGPNKEIDPAEADAWWDANGDRTKPKMKESLPPSASSASVPPIDVIRANPDVAVQFPDGTVVPMDLIPAFGVSQAAKMYWDAEMKMREVKAHDRDHYPKEDVHAANGEIMSHFRASVLGLAGRLANPLEGKTAAERHRMIQDECRAVLEETARRIKDAEDTAYRDTDAGRDDESGDGDEDE